MKRILLPFLFFTCAAHAQVQRQVLVEEFSSASAGLCASVNPAFNQLMGANLAKVIPVKYELALPCCDPFYYQDSTDSQNRSAYYNPQIPFGITDGSPIVNDCPSSFPGFPSCLSQNEIDSMYAIPSPFSLTVNQQINSTLDSITVSVTITAAQNISMVTPVLRLSMRERFVRFYSSPGGTGEKWFYFTNRKMIPDGNGTSLVTSWTNGQTQTFTFHVKIPDYIYDRDQLTFAAWIQDDATHDVLQAGQSAQLPDMYDASLSSVSGLANSCLQAFSLSPTLTLKNNGDSTITSCNIYYTLDNSAVQIYHWSGILLPNATTNVSLLIAPPTNGIDHVFRATVNDPNGLMDFDHMNDRITVNFIVGSAPASLIPYTEDFENGFPPTGISIDSDDSLINWMQNANGGFGNSANCAYMDFWDYTPTLAQKDYLYLPFIDLSQANMFVYLDFSLAYMTYINPVTQVHTHDSLLVQVSTDCGNTWNTLYAKSDTILATVPGSGFNFVPAANQWRKDTVDLSAYFGNPSLAIRFKTNNDYGNPLYLDDIHIDQADAIVNSGLNNKVKIYPVPARDELFVELASPSNGMRMNIYDAMGKQVRSAAIIAGKNSVDVSGLAPGFYSYELIGEQTGRTNGKFLIVRQ
ncbi:MAG TPA: choice-of-anchor J domain-containing protein [Bacteroidia bacterium]|jgi:hypothetical protein|nr:choice-of-anchor J domain-containing protein [Bacteroidia bacterium]